MDGQLRAPVPGTRCPFCHEDVPARGAEARVCARCLARRHDACWEEAARCSACTHDAALAPTARRAARAAGGIAVVGTLAGGVVVALLALGPDPERASGEQPPAAPTPPPAIEAQAAPLTTLAPSARERPAVLDARLRSHAEGGVEVLAVSRETFAHQAGLAPGDVITRADMRPVADLAALEGEVARRRPGDALSLQVRSGGQGPERGLTLVLGWELPAGERVSEGEARDRLRRWLGLRVEAIERPDGESALPILGRPETHEVAFEAGLEGPARILSVNAQRVDRAADLLAALAQYPSGATVVVLVEEGGAAGEPSARELTLPLGGAPW